MRQKSASTPQAPPDAASGKARPTCVLTVDLDECSSSRPCLAAEAWIEPAVHGILNVFEDHGILATFFVCAGAAAAHPALIRQIQHNGHEIACHGSVCPHMPGSSPAAFRRQAAALKRELEELTGAPVQGFRAAGFSITGWELPAIEILAEEGYEYDSSVNPVHHRRLPRRPVLLRARARPLVEIPVTGVRIAGCNVPCGGYSWRHLPWMAARSVLASTFRRTALPGMLALGLADFGAAAARRPARFFEDFSFQTAAAAAKRILAEPSPHWAPVSLASLLPARSRLWHYIYDVDSY